MKYNVENRNFGRWTAIKFSFMRNNVPYWECLCNCGKIKFISVYSLVKGLSTSCGCLRVDFPTRTTHGFCGTKFYTAWKAMRQRCNDPNTVGWNSYGGRGITVCNRWNQFINFKEDMYGSYLKHVKEFGDCNTTLDRIDPNLNYCKENCKWATKEEQNQNTRTSSFFRSVDYKAHRYWKIRWQSYLNSCINKKTNSPKFLYVFGVDLPSFIAHIESQFKSWMSWNNHGRGIGKWEFDHIIPCNQFDLSIESERLKCFNYKNIQPLEWLENSVIKRKKDTLLYA